MREAGAKAQAETGVGALLRGWRGARRLSQLDLALSADVSARHLSFLETGRALPSREMLLRLARVLDVPLRDRNALLQAAGYAPIYRETPLDDPQMAGVRQALELILRRHEPFPAVALDRRSDIVMINAGYARLGGALLAPPFTLPPALTVAPRPRLNALRLLFDPRGLRPHIVNWEEVARWLLVRLHRETQGSMDSGRHELLTDLLGSPDVLPDWRQPDLATPPSLVLPVEMRVGDRSARLFTTLTTLGAPQDITLQELRIESFHAADAETDALLRAMIELNRRTRE